MSIVVNIYYSGENGSAQKFAKEMISSGTVDAIRNEAGNIRYDYFFPLGDEETVLLIDSWENQESIDFHHQSPMMNKIAELRDKYNLHMKVERYRSEDTIPDTDQKYIRNWQLWIEISYIPRDLITVIFYYQISLNPLKTQSLSQVSFPLLFPLRYIVPPVFTNSDKGKNKGKKII